eukprot:2800136-Pyramimonas_sp.AAC.1
MDWAENNKLVKKAEWDPYIRENWVSASTFAVAVCALLWRQLAFTKARADVGWEHLSPPTRPS